MSKFKKYWVGGALNVGAGLATSIYGALEERKAMRKLAQADELASGPIRSQAARQRIARQESDAQAAIDAALRAEATAAEQLRQVGPQYLQAATPELLRGTELATERALQQFGDYGARVARAEDDAIVGAANRNIGATLSNLQAAANQARAMTYAGLGQVGTGLASLAAEDWSKKTDAPEVAPKVATDKIDIAPIPTLAFPEEEEEKIPLLPYAPISEEEEDILQMDPTRYKFYDGGQVPEEKEVDALKAMLRMVRTAEKHIPTEKEVAVEEAVEATPGEFDHDSNPIDIVQDGDKIGEMTGGEYIFNPEQAEKLRELAAAGDSELHEFIRTLLSKDEFK